MAYLHNETKKISPNKWIKSYICKFSFGDICISIQYNIENDFVTILFNISK